MCRPTVYCTKAFTCCVFCAVLIAAKSKVHSDDRKNVYRELDLDLAETNSAGNRVLTVNSLQGFIDVLFERLDCATKSLSSRPRTCNKFLCVDAANLVSTALGQQGSPAPATLSEPLFQRVCHTLLDLTVVTLANDDLQLCGNDLDLSRLAAAVNRTAGSSTKTDLREVVTGGNDTAGTGIGPAGLKRLLDLLKGAIKPGTDLNNQNINNGRPTDGHNKHSAAFSIHAEKCLSTDVTMHQLRLAKGESLNDTRLLELSAYITYMIYDGAKVKDTCRKAPQEADFVDSLYDKYASPSGTIDADGLSAIIKDMGSTGSESEHHDDHRRRRRSADDSVSDNLKTCYSGEQIMRIYDTLEGVGKDEFHQLCPALVSQRIYGECKASECHGGGHEDDKDNDDDISTVEKYGYGTIAIFLIAVTAIFGVAVLPFVSERVYAGLMSLFVGLAAGTLSSDAVMHLIPAALGVHDHGSHDHGHGSKIKVEDHVWYGLTFMGGIYLFYLLETLVTRLGVHCHHHQHQPRHSYQSTPLDASDSELDANVADIKLACKMAVEMDKEKEEANIGTIIKSDMSLADTQTTSSSSNSLVLNPLAMMILVGDAVHNFADGLAVGAAFSTGVSSGVATSIAIFCHEVPHELGDFAVLLQSGCSFKKAVCLNMISAMTAFMGLYVGILVATTQTVKSIIFSVAAAMFTYIALVDLIPQLARTKDKFHIILNNIGMLFGIGIIFVIAIFEEHIKV